MSVLSLCACAVVIVCRALAATVAGHDCGEYCHVAANDRPLHLVSTAGLPRCLHALECRSSDVQSGPFATVCVTDKATQGALT